MKTSGIIRGVAFAIWVFWVIIDIIYHREFMEYSSKISAATQQANNSFVNHLSHFLSTWAVFWFPVVLHFYILFNKNVTYMVYIVTLYLGPFSVVFFLKAIYYRGRPYVVHPTVTGCECDPGMPSGHAIMSLVTYYIVYKYCIDNYFRRENTAKLIFRVCLALFCFLMVIGVSVSRIIVGAHSFSQLLMGLIIGVNLLLWITYKNFKTFVRLFKGNFRMIALINLVFLTIFTIAMILINTQWREDTVYWKYWNKCPKCNRSFVLGMAISLAAMYFLPAFYFMFPMKYSRHHARIQWTPEQENRHHLGLSHDMTRYAIYFGITVPALMLAAFFYFVIKPWAAEMSPRNQAFVVFFSLMLIVVYLGFAWTWLKVRLFERCQLDERNDYLDINDLIIEDKIDKEDRRRRVASGEIADSDSSLSSDYVNNWRRSDASEEEIYTDNQH